ncbi:TetR/AcrR family transcriptional regulator [Sulfoacidibacillus thermotolerans]|uniref:HTH tetR-type domain-containing protein n=1 Tax=Sulfoacidibacillus thermotolerans TaxID=1765684 RepID=A0A2U3DC96_SULT2|nr:TetR/AcrR family transcriptional regulator [Sulfoacidibacillus thermotolerans]PWI58896.1 hypothetical protein BM613_02085 [Sulfoacidibacillus thermotolerans]
MKRRDKEQTRQRILEAAVELFSEKGYNDTQVDDIARESETSKGAFYFHFPSKKAIFEAMLQTLVHRIVRDVDEAIDVRQGAVGKIEGALQTVLKTFSRHEKATRLLFVEATGLGRTFDRQVLAAHRAFAGLIAKHLQQAVDDGSIQPIDVHLTAYAWLGAIHEVLMMTLLEPESQPLDSLVDPLVQLLVRSLSQNQTVKDRQLPEEPPQRS